MKNSVPINASYFAVQAVLDVYHAQEHGFHTYRALRAMMKLFSIKNENFLAADKDKLLEVQSVEEFVEFVQSLSSKTINFYDDVDFKPITVCDTTPTLLKATFLLSHAAKNNVKETVIGSTLRDLILHIYPIKVSKKMLSQKNQYDNNDASWKSLGGNGIIEHATPMNSLRKIIFNTETVAELKSALERHHVVVYITKEEDASIPKELRSELPQNGFWQERYAYSDIEIHDELVKFPSKLVSSNNKIG